MMELIMLNVKCLVLSVVAGDIYSSLVLVSELLDAMVRLQGKLYFVCCKMLYALLQVSEIKALCMLCRHIYITYIYIYIYIFRIYIYIYVHCIYTHIFTDMPDIDVMGWAHGSVKVIEPLLKRSLTFLGRVFGFPTPH